MHQVYEFCHLHVSKLLWFFIIAALGWAFAWLSIRRLRGLPGRQRAALAVVRAVFATLAALAAAGPVWVRHGKNVRPAPIIVAVDTSSSMGIPDCANGATRAEVVERLLLRNGGLLDRLAAERTVEVLE
ncbi:MAG: hypothetical protein H5T86_13080, partial [Armatimonadetes bacterium]|nr:hypothetical protein [Armatimonadota bacterium]